MKKHLPLGVAAMTLCLMPILFLSPLVLGVVKKNCGLKTFSGSCNYSGCDLTIYQCSVYDNSPSCETQGKQRQIVVNDFSCVLTNPPDQTKACDPALNSNGTAATTDCVLKYSCILDPEFEICYTGTKTGSCVAPYYIDETCP